MKKKRSHLCAGGWVVQLYGARSGPKDPPVRYPSLHCTAPVFTKTTQIQLQCKEIQIQYKYKYNARKYRYNAGKYRYNAEKYRYNAGKYRYNAGKYRHNAEKFKYNTGKKIWLQLGLVKKVALDLTYILSS